jgi:pyrroloquinoline quinone biosynthesis protein D
MDLNSIPRLAPGCRLHPSEPVLLVPEGTLNLAGPARDILAQLDGRQSVASIVEVLLQQYSGAPRDEMSHDVLNLLNRMEQRGVVCRTDESLRNEAGHTERSFTP